MSLFAAFAPDNRYDREHASDFQSRYGAYLRRSVREFHDCDAELTADPLEFAAAAWMVASSPVMSPAYVTSHPRVIAAVPVWDYDHRMAIQVDIADGVPADAARALRGRWTGWRREDHWYVPVDNDRPVATALLQFRVPMPAIGLPEPHYTDTGTPDVEVAKDAIEVLCGRLNAALDGVFAGFDRTAVA